MISPRDRGGEVARFYTVTEPKRHPRGYTLYKVTARIVSRRNPEDVQEIVVWKRYSDFKKLHKELWQIHKHLFRHTELFPPFAKAIVFGRFDESVIEERRQCAEDLLQFSANIPALYNSKQLEDFFKDGEVHDGSELIGPADPSWDSLTDSVSVCSSEAHRDVSGIDDVTFSQSECGGFSSDSDLIPLTVDVDSLAGLDDGMASNQNSPNRLFALSFAAELSAQSSAASDHEWSKPDGESSPTRREAVKRKTSEYLMRAEKISSLYCRPVSEDGSVCGPPGSLSSRPSWNLRSPAEELKAFRVLGVIDKVLLVMDTRTQQTFILKGLRKSSEYSRKRKTIIPRCVPNMVALHKYIISEESVFLVLHHAEGGKLWSYISKFLNRSPEESFEAAKSRRSSSTKIHLHQATPSVQDHSSSIDSRGSSGGNLLQVVPLKTSLSPSSHSSNLEDGQESSPKWIDSVSSSDEECTTSYLTLCNEYGQEKVDPGSLNEEAVKADDDLLICEQGDFQEHDVVASRNLGSPFTSQEVKLFADDAEPEITSPTRISESLNKSKNSPMELFRIDSKDSTSELLGLDFGDKLYSLKSEPLKQFFPMPSWDRSLDAIENKLGPTSQDNISRGSNDSVPVISFKDVAFDDVSSVDEGRPDLLVNLPGITEQMTEATADGPVNLTKPNGDVVESKLLETPDVLQLHNSTDPCRALEQKVNSFGAEGPKAQCSDTQEVVRAFHMSESNSGDGALSEGLGAASSSLDACRTRETLLIPNKQAGAEEQSFNVDKEAVLLFSDETEDLSNEGTAPTLLTRTESKELGARGRGENEIHQMFQDLDERLALTSRFYIPEGCVQRWAAELVVALDALHQEGIVCRDLNPNNILLNDRGHIQLTYFSRWSEVEDSCDNDAIERMYCAPEVGAVFEESEACDWWSLGALLFELLSGKTLMECHPAGINTHTTLNVPDHISEEARSLLQQLLQFNAVERLGAGVAGVEDIKSHPFFVSIDWAELIK
ncbi:ribosomal protein S6 kinase delta-1 isoform X1 [Sphaerodactylus townsendi]|uniref:ribosomal protein S6 kinase delta-1 isoform X1 n=1 Tax=Sphaerodactylus townsendi TaxID=933632 RepID=UPI00202760CC|nr:ribosomal protein S6 kinase delta-1 isoform X1 [Sphaerodactylus townsendi]